MNIVLIEKSDEWVALKEQEQYTEETRSAGFSSSISDVFNQVQFEKTSLDAL
jgi:hypothetical protein